MALKNFGFQFLIGRLATQAAEIETDSAYTFQFLIGRLATSKS